MEHNQSVEFNENKKSLSHTKFGKFNNDLFFLVWMINNILLKRKRMKPEKMGSIQEQHNT